MSHRQKKWAVVGLVAVSCALAAACNWISSTCSVDADCPTGTGGEQIAYCNQDDHVCFLLSPDGGDDAGADAGSTGDS